MNVLSFYLKQKSVKAEILDFDKPTKTCADAASLLKVPVSSIIKTIILIDEKDRTIAVILPGNKKVSSSKICRSLSLKKAFIAGPEEVLKRTGYEAGAVPPLGFAALFIFDKSVHGVVYAGGGTVNSLLKIDTKEIVRVINPVIFDVCKSN